MKKIKQYGLGLLETTLALLIGAIMMSGFIVMQADNAKLNQSMTSASKMTEILNASNSYLQSNSTALLSATAGGNLIQIPVAKTSLNDAVPAGLSAQLPSLQGGGYLGTGFIDSDNFGQSHTLLVQQDVNGTLEGLVVGVGGREIQDKYLGAITTKLGAPGGAVYSINNATVQGAGGGWAFNASDWGNIPSVGHPASYLTFATATAPNYLYRDNVGVSALNTMTTNLNMGNNNINGSGSVSGNNSNFTTSNVTGNSTIGGNETVTGNLSVTGNTTSQGIVTGTAGIQTGLTATINTPCTTKNMLAYDSSSNTPLWCNGTSWTDFSSGGGFTTPLPIDGVSIQYMGGGFGTPQQMPGFKNLYLIFGGNFKNLTSKPILMQGKGSQYQNTITIDPNSGQTLSWNCLPDYNSFYNDYYYINNVVDSLQPNNCGNTADYGPGNCYSDYYWINGQLGPYYLKENVVFSNQEGVIYFYNGVLAGFLSSGDTVSIAQNDILYQNPVFFQNSTGCGYFVQFLQ